MEKTKKRKTKAKESKENIEAKLSEERLINALNEESLFINATHLNEKMVNDFYKFYRRKVKRADFWSLLLCGFVLVAIGINFLLEGEDYFFGLICNIIINAFLIFLGVYLWVYAFKYQKFNKKESKKIYDDDISTFTNYYYFDDERVIIKNKVGTTERTYECLEAVYDTKNFYYILLTKDSGYIIKKDSFTKGDEKNFNNFIKGKMGKGFKKR